MRLEAVAGRPIRLTYKGVVVEEPDPVVDPVLRYRINSDLTDVTEPLGIPSESDVCFGVVAGVVAERLFRIGQ